MRTRVASEVHCARKTYVKIWKPHIADCPRRVRISTHPRRILHHVPHHVRMLARRSGRQQGAVEASVEALILHRMDGSLGVQWTN